MEDILMEAVVLSRTLIFEFFLLAGFACSQQEEFMKLHKSMVTSFGKTRNVLVDVESLTMPPDKCSGKKPNIKKALSRKGPTRMDRRNGEEKDPNDTTKKVIVKVVCSETEEPKQPSVPNKALLLVPNSANTHVSDARDVKIRKSNRLLAINPRRIFLLFASLSSMGTIVLIYFTLAIYHRQIVE